MALGMKVWWMCTLMLTLLMAILGMAILGKVKPCEGVFDICTLCMRG